MIYAVDFDGTLCSSAWPGIGEPNRELISFLLGEQKNGSELILWTMREGKALQEAVDWCGSHGLVFDVVNDNVESAKRKWNNNPRKVYADVYIDDHNMIPNPTSAIFRAMNNNNLFRQKGSNMDTNTERHKRVCYELNRIYDKKNRDYGNSFSISYKDYGLVMAAIRIGDKYNRLHNLTSRNKDIQHVADESIRDTLLDLANYAIMAVMEMDAESEPTITTRPLPDGIWIKEDE